MTERTLSIIKPDAVAKNVIGQIVARFEGDPFVKNTHGKGIDATLCDEGAIGGGQVGVGELQDRFFTGSQQQGYSQDI